MICHAYYDQMASLVPQIWMLQHARTFSYKASQLWNRLPIIVRDSDTVSVFKSRLVIHFVISFFFFYRQDLEGSLAWSSLTIPRQSLT